MNETVARIDSHLEAEREALLDLSHRIHANPEIRFEEVQASAWLCEALERRGFSVERGVAGLPTAFRAELDGARPGPTVALLCEYDALPGIGHACGHNVIATMGAGAAFALAVWGLAGLALTVGTSKLLRSTLTGVTELDPAVTALGMGGLALVGLAACLVPAWRATRINPVDALRND